MIFSMDEHKDVVETSEERTSDHVAAKDNDKPQIVESANDVQICSVVMETSIERVSDHVAGADCEKTRIVDSAASDVQVGSGVAETLKETAPDHVAGGDCEDTPIIDSAASDVQVASGVLQTSKETPTDHAASADCEKTGIVDSAASDVDVGHDVVETSKEILSDHVASGDCEKTQIVDSADSNIQIGSTIVVTLKETAINHVSCADSEKIQIVESAASDIQVQVQDATNVSSTERVDAADSGACNGADVSVEIMLSDMHVDGDSTRDTGDDGGGKMSEDGNSSPGESKDIGSKRDMEELVAESDEADDSGSKSITELDIEALELKREGEVEKSSEIAESKEEKLVDDQTTIKEVSDSVAEGSTSAEGQDVLEDMAAAEGGEESVGTLRGEYVEVSGVNVNPEIDTKVVHSSTEIVNPTIVTQVVEEAVVVVDNHKNHENQISKIDGSDVVNSGISSLEKDSDSEDSDPIDNMISKSLDEDTHIAFDGSVASTDDEDITNVEDSQSSQQPGDVVATENKMFLHSEKDEKLVLEEIQNRSMSCDSCQVHSNVEVSVSNSNSGLEALGEEGDHSRKIEGLNGDRTALNENVADVELVDSHQEQNTEAEEQDIDSEEPKTTEGKLAKQASLRESTVKADGATYHLPPDVEGEFGVSDLVWGKVRSHPWWPGQIFHPSDASEKAMKYHKKESFLVAYFGDRTFAWNDASVLKPFRSHFSRVQKQTNSETFHDAVDCALEEVSRRVEFGLACSCIPEDIYNKINHQMVENAGIRQESSVQNGIEKSLCADLFEPGNLVEYMKSLAQSPAGGTDRVQIVIARSQLLAFYRLKGYSELPEFQFCGGLLDDADTLLEDKPMADTYPFHEDDVKISSDQQIVRTQRKSYHKRKHNLKDDLHPKKKERSVTGLMVEPWDSVDDEFGPDGKADYKVFSPSSGKERMGPDSLANESESRKSLVKVSTPVSVPKPSFKIGDCIRRVASQMTGSPSILKCNNQKIDESSDGLVADGSDDLVQQSEDSEMNKTTVSTEYSSLNELLVQLYLAARDPLKGYSFLTVIVSFFSDFRNAVILEQREKVSSKKRLQSTDGAPETFEFEDMNDTYWTDRVIQNGSEEQPPRKSRKRNNQLASEDLDKPLNKSNYRKRKSDSNHSLSAEKPVSHVDENAPAELVMHFPVVDSVPSEASLVKMFKRFGPLKESETEVDKDTNRARVVFKKCCDAKAAHSSAMKFNIFGSMLVNYQLNNTITVPFKTEPLVTLQGQEDATVFLQF